jgi:hypothetical protein
MWTSLRRSARRRRVLGVPIALLAVIVCAVTAIAYFIGTGAGSGSASVGTLQTVTVSAFVGGDTPNSVLLPGGAAADVMLRVNNPNSFSVTLVSATGNGAITPDIGHSSCATTGVTFTNQTGLTFTVPVGSSLIHLPGAASMDATSSSGCQGATFNIPVAITVHK